METLIADVCVSLLRSLELTVTNTAKSSNHPFSVAKMLLVSGVQPQAREVYINEWVVGMVTPLCHYTPTKDCLMLFFTVR